MRFKDYLVIHSIGCIFVWSPLDDAWLAVIAFEYQGTLISPKGREVVRGWLILVRHPVAETTHARGNNIAALSTHASEYLHFLLENQGETQYKRNHYTNR